MGKQWDNWSQQSNWDWAAKHDNLDLPGWRMSKKEQTVTQAKLPPLSEDTKAAIDLALFILERGGEIKASTVVAFYKENPKVHAVITAKKRSFRSFCEENEDVLSFHEDDGNSTVQPRLNDLGVAEKLVAFLHQRGGGIGYDELTDFYSEHPLYFPLLSRNQRRIRAFCETYPGLLIWGSQRISAVLCEKLRVTVNQHKPIATVTFPSASMRNVVLPETPGEKQTIDGVLVTVSAFVNNITDIEHPLKAFFQWGANFKKAPTLTSEQIEDWISWKTWKLQRGSKEWEDSPQVAAQAITVKLDGKLPTAKVSIEDCPSADLVARLPSHIAIDGVAVELKISQEKSGKKSSTTTIHLNWGSLKKNASLLSAEKITAYFTECLEGWRDEVAPGKVSDSKEDWQPLPASGEKAESAKPAAAGSAETSGATGTSSGEKVTETAEAAATFDDYLRENSNKLLGESSASLKEVYEAERERAGLPCRGSTAYNMVMRHLRQAADSFLVEYEVRQAAADGSKGITAHMHSKMACATITFPSQAARDGVLKAGPNVTISDITGRITPFTEKGSHKASLTKMFLKWGSSLKTAPELSRIEVEDFCVRALRQVHGDEPEKRGDVLMKLQVGSCSATVSVPDCPVPNLVSALGKNMLIDGVQVDVKAADCKSSAYFTWPASQKLAAEALQEHMRTRLDSWRGPEKEKEAHGEGASTEQTHKEDASAEPNSVDTKPEESQAATKGGVTPKATLSAWVSSSDFTKDEKDDLPTTEPKESKECTTLLDLIPQRLWAEGDPFGSERVERVLQDMGAFALYVDDHSQQWASRSGLDHLTQKFYPMERQKCLQQITLLLGHRPEASWGTQRVFLLPDADTRVQQEDLDRILKRVPALGRQQTIVLRDTIHRLSVTMDPSGKPCGVSIRLGNFIQGACDTISEFLRVKNAVTMFVGPICSGKTTALRDAARLLAESSSVLVIDPTMELGGAGTIPHAALGGAWRVGLPKPSQEVEGVCQLIESYCPQTVIMDGLTPTKATQIATCCKEMGVSLIGAVRCTMHGMLSALESTCHQGTYLRSPVDQIIILPRLTEESAPWCVISDVHEALLNPTTAAATASGAAEAAATAASPRPSSAGPHYETMTL
eukprot:TRINITY_DN50310_c0_g2_i1.p1 TRINITY_DN50310_c0_g2~~TRINITY_DN50310_c0_g2_i1.p1  ORF type:complete len:1125 (-),score=122.56 TRINITY_DN50310_c0_g2_i1:435-3809(-)